MAEQRQPVVVVTGASAGVGRATARAFARRGYAVGLLARGIDGLEGARRDVEAAGSAAVIVPTDVAFADQVEAAAATVERVLGPIDVWVNATVSVFSPVIQMTPDEYRRVTDVTYLGYVYGTLAALRRMVPRNAGAIVQVGSALAYRAIPLQSAYCAAKHAIAGFTESLRTELLHDASAVRLTMVHLPAINTPQFDWNRSRMARVPQRSAHFPAGGRGRRHCLGRYPSPARTVCRVAHGESDRGRQDRAGSAGSLLGDTRVRGTAKQ